MNWQPSEHWDFVPFTGRYYYYKREERKSLIVGNDGAKPCPKYWYFVFSRGLEIAQGEGFATRQEAQLAAEAV